MKKTLSKLLKGVGEKAAEVPVTVRCFPYGWHQPKAPKSIQARMQTNK